MKTTLIFDPDITGHHREYLNHLYIRAGEKANEKYIFLVHPGLQEFENHFKWPPFGNVVMNYLNYNEIGKMGGNKFKAAFFRSAILKKNIRKNHPSHIFLVEIMLVIPFLLFFLKPPLKVSGIIYNISFRRSKRRSSYKRFLDYFKFFIFSYFKLFDHILLLNDNASARLLNRKFKCDKFHFLPDPVNLLPSSDFTDLRELYKITQEEKVFLHFGGLALRKGTTDILSAIDLIDKALLKNACFIFLGFINDDIRAQFTEMTRKLSGKVRIIVFEGFCSYDLLGHWCSMADYILIPYRMSSQSSGILGYAAQYNVPVIGNSAGLIGSLIKSYKLGYVYDLSDPRNLVKVLIKHLNELSSEIDGNSYLQANTIFSFQKCILG